MVRKYCCLFILSESIITVVMKFTCIVDKSLQSLDYFSTKSLSLWTHLFHLGVRLSRKTFCWSFVALHTRSVPASRRPQNGGLEVYPSGGQNDVSRRVLHRDCGEDDDVIRLPVWSKTSNLLFQILQRLHIRNELIVAPLSKNYTKKIPSLSQKTPTMTSALEVCTLNLLCLILPTVPI